MSPPSPSRPGDRIGDRCTLQNELGRGASGIVCRGRDSGTGDEVAISMKVLDFGVAKSDQGQWGKRSCSRSADRPAPWPCHLAIGTMTRRNPEER